MTYPKESRNYTNPKKLLYEFPHPGLLPLEKVTMRTYWDWYYSLLKGVSKLARCQKGPKYGYELPKKFIEMMSIRLGVAHQKMVGEWNLTGLGWHSKPELFVG